MKLIKTIMVCSCTLLIHANASAADAFYTAHIDASGKILSQSPKWISYVTKENQAGYLSQYKLTLDPKVVKQNPTFCGVSPIDASNYDRMMHGQAKVIGLPLARNVTVQTQLVDMPGASGDNSLEFMIMCTR